MKLESYWAQISKDLVEFQAIAESENVEVENIEQTLKNLIDDQFIETATENGIARRETLLKIRPYADDTIYTRRERLKFLWNNTLPYTDRMLENRLNLVVGVNGYEITRNYGAYTLTILINLGVKRLFLEVEKGIRGMIPANLILTLDLRYNRYEDLAQYTYSYLTGKTYLEIREEVL